MDNENSKSKIEIFYNSISVICIIVAFLNTIYTPGWLWLFIFTLGPVHAIFFFFSNYYLAKYAKKSVLTNLLFWISCITFTMIYVLMPEFNDISSYAFFGTIYDTKTIDMFAIIVKYSLCVNIITSILSGFILYKKEKKN